MNCIAVLNEESERILAQHTIEAMRPKAKTKYVGAGSASRSNNFYQPGTVQAQAAFGGFIVRTPSGIFQERLLIIIRKILVTPRARNLWRQKLLEYLRMSFWTRYLHALGSIITGR